MTGVDPKGLEAATKTWFGAQFDNFSGEHLRKVRNRMRGAVRAYLNASEAETSAALTPLKGAPASTPPATKGVTEAIDSRFHDRAKEKLKLWFFRDMSDEQRLKLFSLFGLPTDEIGKTHGHQSIALKHVLEAISTPTAPELGAVKVKPIEWVRRPIIGGEDRIMSYDGYYWLSRASDGFMVIGEDGIGHAQRLSGTVYPTEDAAQAAAQQHFESRILSALVRPATHIDQSETDEMQPDKYTTGDFNGVVRGKRPGSGEGGL